MAKAKPTQAELERRARVHPMYDQFMAQKAMTKKEVMKLRAGTWIEVRWMDAPNSVVLMIERPYPDTLSFKCLAFDTKETYYQHVDHNQVVRVLGKVEPPALSSYLVNALEKA